MLSIQHFFAFPNINNSTAQMMPESGIETPPHKLQPNGPDQSEELGIHCRRVFRFQNFVVYFILLQLITATFCQNLSPVPIPAPSTQNSSALYNINSTINQTLANLNDEAVYIGEFQSLDGSAIFDWISEKEGEIHLNFEKFESVESESRRESTKKKAIFHQFIKSPSHSMNVGGGLETEEKYKVSMLLLNPQYITEELLSIQFDITPRRLVDPNVTSQQSNITVEKCNILGENEWACNNTHMNYTKYWRRTKVQEDSLNYLYINYRMKLETKETTDYKQYKISFEMQQTPKGTGLGDLSASSLIIHLRSKQPLVLRNRIGSFTVYCSFIILLILIQIISGHHINKSLTNNHMMAYKFSLVTMSYCTVADLSAAIDYAYQALDATGIYYKIFLFIPTIALIFLYFNYDIQILTRVLLAKFVNRNADGERVNMKKFLIIFYIGFFVSYEGFVLLQAFFEYEWWLIILTSCFVFLPQIIRNARRGFGGDNGFNHWYIVGFLATRAIQTLYEHACPANYLKIKPFVWMAILLSALMILSMLVLFLQSKYGAVFFIPKFLRPGHYNYSRKLKVDEGMDQNLECVICLHDVRESPAQESSNFNESRHEELKASMLSEIVIYRTPCGHIFHEDCLKSWIQVKLECPTCRAKLPML